LVLATCSFFFLLFGHAAVADDCSVIYLSKNLFGGEYASRDTLFPIFTLLYHISSSSSSSTTIHPRDLLTLLVWIQFISGA
jgi:hypothetical protein